jgi:hypothetical protein
MNRTSLTDTQRQILEFLFRHDPGDKNPDVFETRNTICGELRLALHEYDEACEGLTRMNLLVTDPPLAHDCDFVRLSPAGRRLFTG